jgi:hypothetical protein
MSELGKAAYVAWSEAQWDYAHNSDRYPLWDRLSEGAQDAWDEIADAVIQKAIDLLPIHK